MIRMLAGRARIAPVIAFVLCLALGCSLDRSVWPDVSDLSPGEALVLAQDMEGPPPFPPLDVRRGKGRVAQYGRRLLMEVSVLDDGGRTSDRLAITVLWPPVDRDRLPDGYIQVMVSSGEVPEYFFTCIAGMREGGIRDITLPRTVTPPNTAARCFRDATTGRRMDLPGDRQVRLRVELVKVTKPRIVLLTTYSLPAMRNRRVVEF